MRSPIFAAIAALISITSLTPPALAMGSTKTVATSNQPVAPEDRAAFVGDNTVFINCQFRAGTFDAMSRSPEYRTMIEHYNTAARAALPGVDNQADFLEYRSKYFAVRRTISASFGCAAEPTPLSTERR